MSTPELPSPPAPLTIRGRGETGSSPQGAVSEHDGEVGAEHVAALGTESPSPEARERGWGEGNEGRKRRILLALLALQIILIVAGFLYWYRTPTAPALPPFPGQPAARINGGATYESALPIAQDQADAWLPDARLLNAAMQVDWEWTVPDTPVTTLPPTGWLTYTFIAPWQPWGKPPGAASLDVIMDRLSGEVVRQDTLGWATAPEWREPPPPSAINSTQATLRAEAAGGTAFRRSCPDLRHLSRTFPLAAGRTAWPQHWVIIYEDTRVREQQGLLVRIDAATGEVLETRQDAPACPESP
ncbi:MAG TPA: hypothetical protein VFG99_01405 [Chloroflexia bacterium]|nr:hypothetical protein [Chloroflexia bacterium]